MKAFQSESDVLQFADQCASGPFSVLITDVITGRHAVGRTWEGMKRAGYPRDWFLWGYRMHTTFVKGEPLS